MIRKPTAYIIGLVAIVVAALGSFMGGWRMSQSLYTMSKDIPPTTTSGPASDELPDNLGLYWQVWDLVHAEFYYAERLDDQRMIYGSIKGMLSTLNDVYTGFDEPDVARRSRLELQGAFEGIGILMGIRQGQLVVVGPLKNSPAFNAGLHSDDIILQIDDINVGTLIEELGNDDALDEVSNMLSGRVGTSVHLRIFRPSEGDTFEVDIVRDETDAVAVKVLRETPEATPEPLAHVETVQSDVDVITRDVGSLRRINGRMLDDGVAYVQIKELNQKIPDELGGVLSDVLRLEPTSMVLDLRDNTGGTIEAAREVLGYFYDGVAFYEENSKGDVYTFDTIPRQGSARVPPMPMVILVNGQTASAGEILAGALSEQHADAVMLGTTTAGKGSLQNVHRLRDESSVRITIAHWFTPDNNRIHQRGLTPDYRVEQSHELTYTVPCVGDAILTSEQAGCADAQLYYALRLLTEDTPPPTATPTPSPDSGD